VAPDALTETGEAVSVIALIHRKSPRRHSAHAVRLDGAIRSIPMLDILMLALGLGFVALAIGYTYACERL
jgi:hypothetical protein